ARWRGIAGTVLVHKVAGAAAASGLALDDVAAEAAAAGASLGTMGVALGACTVPAAGKPGFTLGEGEIELGLGIHGEPGVRRAPMEPADALVGRLLEPILARGALAALAGRGIVVERAFAGTFLSALEMAGVSLSVLELDDARLARLD